MNAPQPILLESGPLRVVWQRRGDRYAHAIGIVRDEQFLCLLESIEGTPDDPWPASPVLQEVHLEPRGAEQRVALAVGQAGHSHWSLSAEADAAARELRFDAACRVRATPGWLGSSYSCRSATAELSGTGIARFQAAGGVCELHADAAVVQASDDDETMLRIQPQHAPSGLPATIRWGYRLVWRSK